MSSSKLVLIDGNAIMHRAYHALPPLTTKGGEPINAVYGFVSMLLRIIDNLKPTHIAVCFDRKEPTFRKKEYKKYQAHRPEMDEELGSQFPKAREVVESFDIPVYDKAGFEADDVIGTIASRAVGLQTTDYSKKGEKAVDRRPKAVDSVVIVTGDKDILQLVNDRVKVFLPKRGLSDAQLVGEKEVVELLGVRPDQIVDYKALVGDPSDNYPGVYGIGPKTTVSLLEEFETFDKVYSNLDKLSGSVLEKLKKGKKDGEISLKLAKIVANVPIKFDFEKMAKWNVGDQKTISIFEEYGFRTLKKRIEKVGKQIEKEKQGSLF